MVLRALGSASPHQGPYDIEYTPARAHAVFGALQCNSMRLKSLTKTTAVPRLSFTSARVPNRGFTLVEIMIMVLIIAILAMMGRVALQRITLRARFHLLE